MVYLIIQSHNHLKQIVHSEYHYFTLGIRISDELGVVYT